MSRKKAVVITGSNGNVGQAVVRSLLKADMHVVAIDKEDNGTFDKENQYEFHRADLMNEKATAELIENVLLNHPDISAGVLLAGGFAMGSVHETEMADIQAMIDLNFKTAYHVARPLFAHFMERGSGSLVLVGARPAIRAEQAKSMVAYALGKSLLFRLSEILNAEADTKNVTCSVIVPSVVDTPANRESMPTSNPGKWVTPEEIANVIEFICSDHAVAIREPVYKLYKSS